MANAPHGASIFSQKLDRAAFTAYFLGAVVPLVALGVVVERYVLTDLSDRDSTLGLIGLVVSIGVLSLSSFLVLRRTTRNALQQMNRDNRRLATLLRVSGTLSDAQHGSEAASTAAIHAQELTGARAAFVLVASESAGARPVLLESAGANASKLFQSLSQPLGELAGQVMSENRPAIAGPGATGPSPAMRGISAAALVPLAGDRGPMGALAVVHTGAQERFDADQLDALSTLAGLASVSLRNADLRDAQRNFFAHVTEILVNALDAHLGYNAGHGNRVAQYANRMGRELGLDEDAMQRLHFAALLHDIGMLRLDRSLLDNAKACARHPILGARMLARIRLWNEIAPIVQSHHEWFDGSGYPEGLAGDAIPLLSRIIAVCEAFDTMTAATSYKASLGFDEAVAEVEAGSGTQFDPRLVDSFRRLVASGVIAPQ